MLELYSILGIAFLIVVGIMSHKIWKILGKELYDKVKGYFTIIIFVTWLLGIIAVILREI